MRSVSIAESDHFERNSHNDNQLSILGHYRGAIYLLVITLALTHYILPIYPNGTLRHND